MSISDLLGRIQSNDNAIRDAAEAQYNQALKTDLRTVMNELLQVVLTGTDDGHCKIAAVLFRGQLVKSNGSEWWQMLQDSERQNVRDVLLQRLRSAGPALRRHVSNIIAQVARISYDGTDEWPNLLGVLAQMAMFDEDDGSLATTAIATIGEMIRVCPGKFEQSPNQVPELHQLMCQIMKNPPRGNNHTRIEAVIVTSGLIGLAEDGVQYDTGVMDMLNAIQYIQKDTEMLLKWFEAVIEAIEMQAKLFIPCGKDLVNVMLNIARSEDHSEDVRKQSLQVCLVVITEIPMVIKEDEAIIRSLLEVCIVLMLHSDDGPDEIEDGLVDGAAEEENLCDAGARGVYFVSESIGEARVLPILFPMVEALLQPGGDWKRERAGLFALMRSVYRSGRLMYGHLAQVLQCIIPFVTNEATIIKVRLVALEALSSFFIMFGDPDEIHNMFINEDEVDGERVTTDEPERPNIQKLFGEPLLDAISSVLSEPTANTAHQWALRAKGARCLSHFCFPYEDGSGAEILGKKAPELLGKLFQLIEKSGAVQMQIRQQHGIGYVENMIDLSEVQCNALDAVGNVAKALGTDFIQYYDTFMPLAERVYQVQEELVASGAQLKKDKHSSAWTEKQVNLRGTAFEAISYMGTAVGKEKFAQDASRLIQMVVSYMTNIWNQGDLERNRQVADLASNICTTMGHVDEAILQKLIPPLIKWADIEVFTQVPEEEVFGDDSEDEDDEEGMQKSYVQTEDGTFICVNTFNYKEKESAARILQELIHGLGKDLMPWAGDMSNLFITELKQDYSSPDLQLLASASLAKILRATSSFLMSQPNPTVEQIGFAQNLFDQSIDTLLSVLMDALREAIEEDAERIEEVKLGKEFEDDDDETQLVITNLANHITTILRISFESGGRSDTNADYMCDPGFTNEKCPPRFAVKLGDVRPLFQSLHDIMMESFNRPRGHSWWKESNNQEIMDLLSESVGLVLKMHGPAVFPEFAEIILPMAFKLLDTPVNPAGGGGVTSALHGVALFFIDDAITYCKPVSNALVPKAMPYLLLHSQSKNFVLRQAAVFGIGLAAEDGGAAFDPFVEQSVNALVACIDAPDSRNGNNASATENAISSLLKLAIFRDQWGALPKVISSLPCKSDVHEARIVHYRMFTALRDGHPQFAPFAEQIKQILVAAHQEKFGWSTKTNSFDAEYAILSDLTRQWVVANLPV